MPNGETIDSSSTFSSIRSFYKNDPAWSKIEAYLKAAPRPSSPTTGSGPRRT